MTTKKLPPVPPGEILLEEFTKPLGISQNRPARDIDVPVGRISEIVNGRRAITADTALRPGECFGTSPEMWLGLQMDYDIRRARQDERPAIESRIRPIKAARQSLLERSPFTGPATARSCAGS
jgi:addiction module HigA family antidote